ncbi:MAG: GSCFA domain-containing protein [Rhodospirillaceae bacterium]
MTKEPAPPQIKERAPPQIKERAPPRYPFPTETAQLSDLRAGIKKYVLAGHVPEKPLFAANAKILTLGSCFAENINDALSRAGFDSTYLAVSEATNTPAFANLLVNRLRAGHLGGLIGDTGPGVIAEKALVPIRALLPTANVFVLTLGVAVQPFIDGRPAFFTEWSPLTKKTLRASSWRMLSGDEILNYIRATVSGLRALRPGVPVFLTLSPIPLMNSLLHPSVIAQDCVSKSRLRVAIDDLMDEQIPDLFYWPSFEIVRWIGSHVGPFFGTGGADQRHVSPEILNLITGLFIESFFEPRA